MKCCVQPLLFVIVVNFCTLFCVEVEGQIPMEEIKGIDQVICPQYRRYLSPVRGITFSSVVDNLYRYGDLQIPIVKLVHLLFYQDDPFTIHPSVQHSNVAHNLGARTIGKMLATMVGTPANTPAPVLKKRLMELISNDEEYKQNLRQGNREFEKFQKRASTNIFGVGGPDLQREKSRLNPNFAHKELAVFVDTIVDSIVDSTFMPSIFVEAEAGAPAGAAAGAAENVFRVMTNLLWRKVSSKSEILQYFHGLREGGIPSSSIVMPEDSQWHQRYQWESFSANFSAANFDDYEGVLYYLSQVRGVPFFGYSPIKFFLPQGVQCSITDCVETSIRNFLNHLLFVADEKVFRVEILERMSTVVVVLPQLIDFYRKYNSVEKQEGAEARRAFAQLLSGLNKREEDVDDMIVYRAPLSSLRAEKMYGLSAEGGAHNVLKVFKKLFRGVNSWQELSMAFRSAGVTVDFDFSGVLSTGKGDLIFTLNGDRSVLSGYRWSFSPAHAYLTERGGEPEGIPQRLVEMVPVLESYYAKGDIRGGVERRERVLTALDYFSLFDPRDIGFQNIMGQIVDVEGMSNMEKGSVLSRLIFSLELNSDVERSFVAEKVLLYAENLVDTPPLNMLLKNIINGITDEDLFRKVLRRIFSDHVRQPYQTQAFYSLIKHRYSAVWQKLLQQQVPQQELLTSSERRSLLYIAFIALHEGVEEFYSWAHPQLLQQQLLQQQLLQQLQLLPQPLDLENTLYCCDILAQVVDRGITSLYHLITNNNLLICDKSTRGSIIKSILAQHRTEFYYLVDLRSLFLSGSYEHNVDGQLLYELVELIFTNKLQDLYSQVSMELLSLLSDEKRSELLSIRGL
ncbi:MAG: hypothetical protein HQK53_03415 [Oligoflexia bacterium]|nr:hypothetical protein [Oligoflexia bacterium]